MDVLHVTSHIRVLSSPVLACFQYSLQLYIWKPSPCLVCLPAAHFPGGGIRQWHFSIISLPQWFPSTRLLTPPCNCCHNPFPCNLDYDLSNTFLKMTHFISQKTTSHHSYHLQLMAGNHRNINNAFITIYNNSVTDTMFKKKKKPKCSCVSMLCQRKRD